MFEVSFSEFRRCFRFRPVQTIQIHEIEVVVVTLAERYVFIASGMILAIENPA